MLLQPLITCGIVVLEVNFKTVFGIRRLHYFLTWFSTYYDNTQYHCLSEEFFSVCNIDICWYLCKERLLPILWRTTILKIKQLAIFYQSIFMAAENVSNTFYEEFPQWQPLARYLWANSHCVHFKYFLPGILKTSSICSEKSRFISSFISIKLFLKSVSQSQIFSLRIPVTIV